MNHMYVLKKTVALCFIDEHRMLVSRNQYIYIFDFNSREMINVGKLPCRGLKKISIRFQLLARLFRLANRYAVKIDNTKYLIIFDGKFYEFNLDNKDIKEVFEIKRGSRPLNIAAISDVRGIDESLYFGEYFMNKEKNPVNIYKRNSDSSWSVVYTFPKGEIEHIHSIVPDSHNSCAWILTGDFNRGAGIWQARKNFSEIKPVVRGDQIYRACVAFPTDKGLLYATDSQFEKNSIRILCNRNNEWISEFVSELNGPCIYGQQFDQEYYFSTSVEGEPSKKGKYTKFIDRTPGPGIVKPYSHIVAGNIKNGFRTIFKLKKDILPFILFQFGVFNFPRGQNKTKNIVVNSIALKGFGSDCLIFNKTLPIKLFK